MRIPKCIAALLATAVAVSALPTLAVSALPTLAGAAPAAVPAWSIQSIAAPTNFEPGDESGRDNYTVFVTNSGGAPTEEVEGTGEHVPITIVDTLPAGLAVDGVQIFLGAAGSGFPACKVDEAGTAAIVSCEVTDALEPKTKPALLAPGSEIVLKISVKVPPSVTGDLTNRVEVEGGGAQAMSEAVGNEASAADPPPGFEYFTTELTGPDGLPVTAADSHPYNYVTSFAANTVATEPGANGAGVTAGGNLQEVEVALPPGLAANPTVIGRCTAQQFMTLHVPPGGGFVNECPAESMVGLASVQQLEGEGGPGLTVIYNLVPPKGMPAQLGFQVLGLPVYINTRLRSDGDYGVTAYLKSVTEAQRISASRITIWGTPWDASHDWLRGEHIQAPALPFVRLPSSCTNPLLSTFSFETWTRPPATATASFTDAAPTNCAAPPFGPTIEAKPTTDRADSPAGLHFDLHLPQAENEDPEGLGEADLREARVTLPDGLVVNPSSAGGKQSCTPAQVGLATAPGATPAHFDLAPVTCPDASKLGTVEAVAPAIDHPLKGAAYLAAQEDNPFDSLIAFYIVLEDPQTGIVVKLPARVTLDPLTGRLTTTVSESPQVPLEDFRFDFFDGPRAPLRTPMGCGTYTTQTAMTPWTAPEGAKAFPASSFDVTGGPHGPCPSGALDPRLSAGLAATQAGAYSPFSTRLTREDATGEFAGLTVEPPAGLTARLAGVPYCPEAAIDQARGRERPGGGAEENAHPSCPGASQVGTVTAGAGAGPSPFFVGGRVYLAGPYKGAPISLVAVIPALAGPFDLGTVVDRVAVYVDPRSTQVRAVADPLPTIVSGIPVDTRDLRVNLDRPDFTLAPTGCEPKAVGAGVTGASGQGATVSERFQVTGCGALKFRPHLKLTLKGKTRRTGHPAVRATLTFPKGAQANTARAQVSLPHSEFLDQGNLNKVCTQPELNSQSCPRTSIYGHAKAWSPLLEKPLQGPVYLGVGFGYKLPALVAELDGQIRVLLVGKVDTGRNKGIRNTFQMVPDAPVSRFELTLKGGPKYGLLENSEDICRKPQKASVRFVGHNGKVAQYRSRIANSCGGKGRKANHDKGKGKKRHGHGKTRPHKGRSSALVHRLAAW
jgi:hypothetical protein